VYLRTARHPAAEQLGLARSFDRLYETAETFEEVYAAIVEELVAAATDTAPDPIVYAVPGSPLVAERSVALLRNDARVSVSVLPGLSFLDFAWERLRIDPLTDGVRLVDAEQFSEQAGRDQGPFLVAQCWSRHLLSEMKLSVSQDSGDPLPAVVILHHLGLEDEQVLSVDWWELDQAVAPDHLTSIYIPALTVSTMAQREMAQLEDLVVTLRARCPWDRVQTHDSLLPHLIEESYEVVDALSALSSVGVVDDAAHQLAVDHLKEELGDLLFQIVFHACLAQEEGQFTLADVARGIREKLVVRHPHVFGNVDAATPEQVVGNWEIIKKMEKGRSSVTEGIPKSLPALMLATKLQRQALSVGVAPVEFTNIANALEKRIAVLILRASDAGSDGNDIHSVDDGEVVEHLVGSLLFEVTDLARQLGVDPEQALRTRVASLRGRILIAEGVHNPQGGSR
jgi:tetrapyrrole methylase family protein/MazG family protein